jgi:nodulation protein E
LRRVVVTGLGCVTPYGIGVGPFWAGLSAGRSAIAQIEKMEGAERLNIRVAALLESFDPLEHFDEKQLQTVDRVAQFGLLAAREAVAASGIAVEGMAAERAAVILGGGIGGLNTLEDGYKRLYRDGTSRTHPMTVPRQMLNSAASNVSMTHGFKGPCFAISSACSSANHAIGEAYWMIRSGRADVAISGGCEAPVTYGMVRAWESLRVLAPDTCRPFSANRRGLVLGEGAAIVVMETLEGALARGAPILAEIAGYGVTADAGDIVQPSAEGAAAAIRQALSTAGLAPEAIDYINAHGTGTVLNDRTETAAVRAVFGAHADRLAISATKSMHGHALGAAGALELVALIQTIRQGIIPPTANYLGPDPLCDLDCVPNEPRRAQVGAALSNSFAFGGLNAVLAVRRFDA